MQDEHSERQKPQWQTALGLLTGMLIACCILNWHAFRDQGLMTGFKAIRWDDFLQAVGVTAGMIGAWYVRRSMDKGITTLGIGETTANKLQ